MIGPNAASSILSTMSAAVVVTVKRAAIAIALAVVVGAMVAPDVAAQDNQSKEEQGLVAYLGIFPAAMVKGHDPSHAESTMHGGSPSGPHEYHLVVAVFEAATGVRLSDVEVFATITGLGHVGGTRVQLEPMEIAGTTTYGNFMSFPGADLYTVKVTVRPSGAPYPVAFEFSYDHRSR